MFLIYIFRGGLNIFGHVKENWANLSKYFKVLSGVISQTLKKKLDTAFQKMSFGKKMTHLQTKQLKAASKIIHDISTFVYVVSNAYVILSENHLQSMLSDLGTFIALNPSFLNDTGEIEEKMDVLKSKTYDAQKFINENQKTMEMKTNKLSIKSLSLIE